MLPARYDGWLAALSYLVAALASYTAIDLAGRVAEFRAEPRKAAAWLAGGAVAMGAGVWAMHFLGMLAYRLPVPVQYELWTTLVSMVVAIATSGFALFIVTRRDFSLPHLLLGGAVMGAGIGTMHYNGMAAMRLDAQVMYYAGPFALSVVNAVACSTIALWLVSRRTQATTQRKILAAAVMGVAIASMHYTGMYATVCVATSPGSATGGELDPMLLAVAITVITLLIIGMALAVSLQSQLMTRAMRAQNETLLAEVEQRRRVESELQAHRDNLQTLVDTRTRDLSQANQALQESETRFRATFDQAPVGIMHVGVDSGSILLVNRKLCEMLGYEQRELLGMTSANIVDPSQRGNDRANYRDRMLHGEIDTYASERLYVRKDGSDLWVSRTVSMVKDVADNPLYFILVVEDITARRQSAQAQAQLAAIVETSNDAIVGRAPDDAIISWNSAAERLFGWSEQEVLGKSFRQLLTLVPHAPLHGRFEKVLRGEPSPAPLQDVRKRKDGTTITVETTLSAVKDDHGKILFVSCIMRDVTDKIRADRHIEQLATRDTLTGLANRNMLLEKMTDAVARLSRAKSQLAVMFIDLDKFKAVNDMFGHAAGDALLSGCAKRLIDCVREVDVVARLGGDEFVVPLTDLTDTAIVSSIADRMIKSLIAPYRLSGQDAFTSASIGICFYPGDGTNVTALMKNADIAMYHAKELGRNNYQFYAEDMNQRMLARTQLEREIRGALDNNEFVLHYQPQVTVATGAIQGAESLIRWQHTSRGLLPPAAFIAMAEETGLIVPLGVWVLNEACRTIKAWRTKNVNVPYVVVNVSAAQLGDALVTAVRQAVADSGIDATWLMIEITETMLMQRVEEAITILRQIHELGVRIAMDDFGTGYSSLSVLQRLPLDTLKIDRSFVAAIDSDADNARAGAIIGAIIAIAKELNLSVVAEGVETPTQLAYLRRLHCESYQGYLYSKPVGADEIAARYATQTGTAVV